jgi:hypothetical protein
LSTKSAADLKSIFGEAISPLYKAVPELGSAEKKLNGDKKKKRMRDD